jgi:membrane dipeptidase
MLNFPGLLAVILGIILRQSINFFTGVMMIIVDAHEDIAWNKANYNRDYTQSVAQTRDREKDSSVPKTVGQTMLGWPDWIKGNVGVVFATLYVSPCRHHYGGGMCYHDEFEAHRFYREQLQFYHQLVAEHPDKFYLIKSRADLETGLSVWEQTAPTQRRVGLVVLMEGAEAVRHPAELADWVERGVRIIGPAWSGTRYAGGTGEPGPFTALGRDLLAEMARLGVILDISHLTDEGMLEAVSDYPGPLLASHCNARALIPDNDTGFRHLPDTVISRVAARDGVIGIVLPNDFVKNGAKLTDPKAWVTLDDVVNHIDHMSQLVGHTRCIGLGSDFDGGFGLEHAPAELCSVADLPRFEEALTRRGYSAAEIEGILGGNWLNLLRKALPQV